MCPIFLQSSQTSVYTISLGLWCSFRFFTRRRRKKKREKLGCISQLLQNFNLDGSLNISQPDPASPQIIHWYFLKDRLSLRNEEFYGQTRTLVDDVLNAHVKREALIIYHPRIGLRTNNMPLTQERSGFSQPTDLPFTSCQKGQDILTSDSQPPPSTE